METSENQPQPRLKLSPETEKELGPENLRNLTNLCAATQKKAGEQKIDVHLLLVGGVVMPEKSGVEHKDTDVVLYSPDLAPEIFPGGQEPKRFEKFSEFVVGVADALKWKTRVEKPYFDDYDRAEDGKVILALKDSGKPIEVLPVRKDCLLSSLEEYLREEKRPVAVLF